MKQKCCKKFDFLYFSFFINSTFVYDFNVEKFSVLKNIMKNPQQTFNIKKKNTK